jgi:hypothetical protein
MLPASSYFNKAWAYSVGLEEEGKLIEKGRAC